MNNWQFDEKTAGNLYRCSNCYLGFRWPRRNNESLSQEYEQDPSEKYIYQKDFNAAWHKAYDELDKTRRQMKNALMILDIGCYHGKFLTSLKGDWKRFGIEPSIAATMRAKESGIQVIAQHLDHAENDWIQAFDAVTMFDVLEHLEDPAMGIRQALSFVKPGGKLIFSTGNYDSWPFRLLGNYHWYLESLQHLAVLSPQYVSFVIAKEKKCKYDFYSIPHQRLPRLAVIAELFQAIYFKGRISRGAWRPIIRIMHLIPGLKTLRHKNAVPYLMHLRDHFLGVITKE